MCSYPCKIIVVTAYDEIEQLCKELSAIDCIVVRNQGNAKRRNCLKAIRKGIETAVTYPVTATGDSVSYDMFFQADQPYVKAELLHDFLDAFFAAKKGSGL